MADQQNVVYEQNPFVNGLSFELIVTVEYNRAKNT